MNIREKIKDIITHSEIKLLSQIPVSFDEYNELIADMRNYIQHLYVQTVVPANPIVAVALVQIAIRAYSDGNYWDFFNDEIGFTVPASKKNYLGQIFAATLRQYHLFELDREPGAKYAYVENIKAHSYVPDNYLSGYWDFLFAFYDRNILRQLPESIEEEFSEMSEFFADTLNVAGDSISLKNLDNKPAKSYKLLKATRALFAQGDSIILSSEIYRHLQIIDEFYYDNKLPQNSDRFGESFCIWQKRSSEIHDSDNGKTKRRSGKFYHRPYFKIDRSRASVQLIIPEQKIRNDDFSDKVVAIVNENGKSRSFDLSLYRAFGVIVSEPISVPDVDVFGHTEVIIRSLSDRTFDIPECEYRIFDSDSTELAKLKPGQNYLITEKGANVRGHKALYANKDHSIWDEYSYSDIDDESVIYINDTPISITGTFVEGADFAHSSHEYEIFKNGSKLQTAYRHPTVSFRIAKSNYSGAFLWCNNEKYYVDDVAASVVDLPDAPNDYGVTVLLESFLEERAGIYRICVDEPAKNLHEVCNYVFLPDLRCRPEKPRFIFASEAGITITGDYDIEPVNAICVDDGGSDYLVDLTGTDEAGRFRISVDGDIFDMNVPLKIFKHGFEKQWRFDRPDYIWIDDMKNDLYISMSGATEAKVYLASKVSDMVVPGTSLGDGVFRFDISPIVEQIRSSPRPYNYIGLKFRDNKERNLSLYRVLNRTFVDAEVILDDGIPRVDVKYEGKNAPVLRFCDEKTGETVAEKHVVNGMNDFPELSPDGLYTMYKFEETPDPFGFGSELRSIGNPTVRIGVVNPDDISNCKINFRKILWAGKELHLNYSYGVFSLQKIDEVTYTGVLYEQ